VCLKEPDRVDQYLSLNTGHPFVRPTPAPLGTFWRFWYWPILGAPMIGPWLVRHGFFQKVLRRWFATDRAGWSPYDEDVFLESLTDPARALASSKTYRSYLVKDSPEVLLGRHRKQRLSVPTLMLHGVGDNMLREPFLRGYEPFADDMSIELVSDAGHFIAEERPQLVADRALAFFAD
jgi:pimeloyl-ACP methyl ester carboxylesterase